MLLGVVANGVFVAAQNIDGIAADAQARPGNQPMVDRVADGGVGRTRAFGAHVAFGGEAGHQIVARGEHREDGALRNGFLHGLQIFRARMQEEMDVRIDQSGHQGGVAEVDGLGPRRTVHELFPPRRSGRLGPTLPQARDLPAFDIEQTRGVQDDGVVWLGLGQCARCEAGKKKEHWQRFSVHVARWYHFASSLTGWKKRPTRRLHAKRY